MIRALFLSSLCLVSPAFADTPTMRPLPRPAVLAEVVTPEAASADVAETPASEDIASTAAVTQSIRPLPRPDVTEVVARAPRKSLMAKLFGPKKTVARRPDAQAPQGSVKGSVCNDPAILGTLIADIKGAQKGCGVDNPVRITSVDGVALSTPATIDCDTAQALREWVTAEVKPAFGGTGVTGLRVAAHYACRGRNNKKGARISEHGRGKAIDIAGFILANGTEVSVLKHYKSGQGKPIRSAHKGACGIFGTTLGPGSDGYHQDHLHLDTASHRNGSYCK